VDKRDRRGFDDGDGGAASPCGRGDFSADESAADDDHV
jgi:hypothetical protein